MEQLAKELETAVRDAGTPQASSKVLPTTQTGNGADSFSACRQFFAGGKPPVVTPRPTNRDLCFDAFAILHSGESKTAVFVAEKLNRASIVDADEKRTNKFFPDARLRSAERSTLDDYKGSGFNRGHMAPAGDMPTAQAMAQSFSLVDMVPKPQNTTVACGRSQLRPRHANTHQGLRGTFTSSLDLFTNLASPEVQALVPAKYLFQSTCSSWCTTKIQTGLGRIGTLMMMLREGQNQSAMPNW